MALHARQRGVIDGAWDVIALAAFPGNCEGPPEWSVCRNERSCAEDRRKAADGAAGILKSFVAGAGFFVII